MKNPGVILKQKVLDPELGIELDETRQEVPKDSVTPAIGFDGTNYILEDKEEPLNSTTSWRITKYLTAAAFAVLQTGWVEYEDIGYTFPTLAKGAFFADDDTFGPRWITALAGGSVFRPAVSKTVKARTTFTFTYNNFDPITLATITQVGWMLWHGFHCHDALTDGQSFTRTVGASSETLALPTSDPTASTFISSWIGQYKTIGGNSKRWKGLIYIHKKIEVKME